MPQNNETSEVTQADRDCLERVQACLRAATELRAGGTCSETTQAIFWEDMAARHIARHRLSSRSGNTELVEAGVVGMQLALANWSKYSSPDEYDENVYQANKIARAAETLISAIAAHKGGEQ